MVGIIQDSLFQETLEEKNGYCKNSYYSQKQDFQMREANERDSSGYFSDPIGG